MAGLPIKRRPAPIGLRLVAVRSPRNGEPIRALVPASRTDHDALEARRYSEQDLIFAILRKPRSPGFNRLAHRLGMLVAENIEAFAGLDGHQALKRLQLESGAACEEIYIDGGILVRIPVSLAFNSIEEGEFRAAIQVICQHIARRYWPDLTPERVVELAEAMPDA